jgi:argininosuccinate lyase
MSSKNKLWQKKGTETATSVENFTVGNDKLFDIHLAQYDVQGTIAHVKMLAQVGLLTAQEGTAAIEGLKNIATTIKNGEFIIEDGIEDIHSQIEFTLTQKIGDIGKKIHSGRSRNDQVAVDLKLFFKDSIEQIAQKTQLLFNLFIQQSNTYKNVLLPGYTHFQIAMPSSAGLWLGAYAESLVDDLELLAAAYEVANKNPLGSGAGYGSSFPLNRSLTTELLGFKNLNYNSIYAQMTRGKTEKFLSYAIAGLAATLSKFSTDCCLYVNQNFGFITFPENLTTGSSLMPHKKNPDVFELIRGKCNRLQSIPNELTLLINNLPSGYHRDIQLSKEIIFPAITTLLDCMDIAILMLNNIAFNPNILQDEKYKYLFSVEMVNNLVNQGIPFRDAYEQVGNAINNGTFKYDYSTLNHQHQGSIGNLCNTEIEALFATVYKKIVA